MKSFKLINGKTGNEADCGYINGYRIADRFLEGCYFKVELNEDKTDFIVTATDLTKKYLENCESDVTQWEEEVRFFLHDEGDELNSSPQPHNNSSIIIELTNTTKQKEPVKIACKKLTDFL